MGVVSKIEAEFDSQIEELGKMELGTDQYVKTVDGTCKLADRLIAIQKNNDEYDLKLRQMEEEKLKREEEALQNKKRNRIEWAKVIVPTVGAATMGVVTMIWEKFDTMTLTSGKTAFRDILSFRHK